MQCKPFAIGHGDRTGIVNAGGFSAGRSLITDRDMLATWHRRGRRPPPDIGLMQSEIYEVEGQKHRASDHLSEFTTQKQPKRPVEQSEMRAMENQTKGDDRSCLCVFLIFPGGTGLAATREREHSLLLLLLVCAYSLCLITRRVTDSLEHTNPPRRTFIWLRMIHSLGQSLNKFRPRG